MSAAANRRGLLGCLVAQAGCFAEEYRTLPKPPKLDRPFRCGCHGMEKL